MSLATPPVFVSFTTISSRLGLLSRMIDSLLAQTLRADRIILNLSRGPFLLDQGVAFSDLPRDVRSRVAAGDVEVYFTPNSGPYRKLLPTLRRFRGESFFVATADDDWVYPTDWLAGLHDLAASRAGIAAHRVRVMAVRDGRFLPYNAWPSVPPERAALDQLAPAARNLLLCPGGGYGAMYHSSMFPDLDLLEELRALAPEQDDLAIRFVTLLSRIPVRIVGRTVEQGAAATHIGTSNDSLFWLFNVKGGNDAALEQLVRYCGQRFKFDLSTMAS